VGIIILKYKYRGYSWEVKEVKKDVEPSRLKNL
jgi:hypothetical protein